MHAEFSSEGKGDDGGEDDRECKRVGEVVGEVDKYREGFRVVGVELECDNNGNDDGDGSDTRSYTHPETTVQTREKVT